VVLKVPLKQPPSLLLGPPRLLEDPTNKRRRRQVLLQRRLFRNRSQKGMLLPLVWRRQQQLALPVVPSQP
jgi:hypothetical protein